MKKLQLDLEKLAVDSFEPLATPDAEGTVQGHAASYWQSQCKSYCTFERCCSAETFNGTC